MSSLIDLLSFLLTASLFVGTILGVIYVVKKITLAVESTKESLKNRGLHISDHGVSVKTSKRFDREDYVDATQRGFIKAMNAASFGRSASAPGSGPSQNMKAFPVDRSSSSSSAGSLKKDSSNASLKSLDEKEKTRSSIFRMRKADSGTSNK